MLAKSSNTSLFGIDLEPDSYVNTAISIVRILKKEPEDSHASSAKSLLDTMSDVFYNVETVTQWLVFFDVFVVFCRTSQKKFEKCKNISSIEKNCFEIF